MRATRAFMGGMAVRYGSPGTGMMGEARTVVPEVYTNSAMYASIPPGTPVTPGTPDEMSYYYPAEMVPPQQYQAEVQWQPCVQEGVPTYPQQGR